MMTRRLSALAMSALLIGLGACGGASDGGGTTGVTPYTGGTGGTGGSGGNGQPVSNTPNTVTVTESSFLPGTLNVSKGTTVSWKWSSCSDPNGSGYGGCVAHNVTFDDGSQVASPTQSEGTFTRVFDNAGTYKYHCTIHGAMTGSVTVQ